MDSIIPVTVHLTSETHATLIRAAADVRLSLSDFIVRLLELAAHEHTEIEHVVEAFSSGGD
ncbi:hypothetical protein LPLAFNJD_LOCUS1858 [Methylorubrum aminovorans]